MASKKVDKSKRSPTKEQALRAVVSWHLNALRLFSRSSMTRVAEIEKELGLAKHDDDDVLDDSRCVVCTRSRGKSLGFCGDCQADYNIARKACKDDGFTMMSWAATRARKFAKGEV